MCPYSVEMINRKFRTQFDKLLMAVRQNEKKKKPMEKDVSKEKEGL